MYLNELIKKIDGMNENMQTHVASLMKLKILDFKKHLKKRKEELEQLVKNNPKDKEYAGQLFAYDEILRIAEVKLNIEKIHH